MESGGSTELEIKALDEMIQKIKSCGRYTDFDLIRKHKLCLMHLIVECFCACDEHTWAPFRTLVEEQNYTDRNQMKQGMDKVNVVNFDIQFPDAETVACAAEQCRAYLQALVGDTASVTIRKGIHSIALWHRDASQIQMDEQRCFDMITTVMSSAGTITSPGNIRTLAVPLPTLINYTTHFFGCDLDLSAVFKIPGDMYKRIDDALGRYSEIHDLCFQLKDSPLLDFCDTVEAWLLRFMHFSPDVCKWNGGVMELGCQAHCAPEAEVRKAKAGMKKGEELPRRILLIRPYDKARYEKCKKILAEAQYPPCIYANNSVVSRRLSSDTSQSRGRSRSPKTKFRSRSRSRSPDTRSGI